MKARVNYRDGQAVNFVVPNTMTVDDFIKIAKIHGAIKSIEFPE